MESRRASSGNLQRTDEKDFPLPNKKTTRRGRLFGFAVGDGDGNGGEDGEVAGAKDGFNCDGVGSPIGFARTIGPEFESVIASYLPIGR